MAQRVRISCITKSDRPNIHERILQIGGQNPNGTPWRLSLQQAVAGIQNGSWDFYVSVNGRTADAIVAVGPSGQNYLRTTADSQTQNNLLSLPECE